MTLILSKKECFNLYKTFRENHPERVQNKKVTLEDLEEVLSDYVIFTRQPKSKA